MGDSALPATLETVAVAVHLQDVAMVGEAVQQGPGEPLRPEDLGPLVEGKVGGHQDGAPLVSLAEDLEEQFRPGGGQGDESQLVDDQQAEAGKLSLEVEQASFIPGLHQLVDAGADVNLKDNLWNSDPSGGSLLDFAKWNGNPEIIQILVDAGAKATEQVTVVEEGHFPEAVEERYPTTASGLYGAVADGDVAAVRRLVEAGVDVDAKAAGGESILNNAVIRAGPEIVQVLVDGRANVNAEDNLGRSVLYEAAEFDPDPEIVQILVVAGADVNFKYDDGGPILRSILYEAARNFDPNPEVVRVLVDAGADVNEIIYEGRSILHDIVTDSRANPEVVRILVEAGTDVNAIDDDGRSILYQAVTYSLTDPEIVRILVDAGADVNFKYEYGDPILFEAATGFDPNPEIVRILVDAGADVNARDRSGTSALKAAKGRGNLDVARILTEAGAVE